MYYTKLDCILNLSWNLEVSDAFFSILGNATITVFRITFNLNRLTKSPRMCYISSGYI